MRSTRTATRAFDFDIVVGSWGKSLSPGNEQRGYWGSRAADQPGSRNLIGIKNPAVDKLIDRVVFAKSREELVAATQALDRVLLWNNYIVPQWTYGKVAGARLGPLLPPERCRNTARRLPDRVVVGRRPRRRKPEAGSDPRGRPHPPQVLVLSAGDARGGRRRLCHGPMWAAPQPADATTVHGISAFGDLKYPRDFRHFDYVDPNAPEGRRVFPDRTEPGSTIRTSSPSIRSTASSSRATPRRAWS